MTCSQTSNGYRCVCDTNVLISGLLTAGIPSKILSYFLLDAGKLVFSEVTAGELIRALMRNKLDRYVSRRKRREVLHEILFSSEFVVPVESRTLCRDPDDDPLLDAAVAARVDYLISGDEDLQVLGDVEGIPIVSPAEFLRRHESRQ